MGNRFYSDGAKLSSSIHFIKDKAESWSIVGRMDQFFANNPFGDYLYFTLEAFEHCCTLLRKRSLDGNLNTFKGLSNADFKVISGENVFEGYYAPHGLIQACLAYHDSHFPSPSFPLSGERKESEDEEFEGEVEESGEDKESAAAVGGNLLHFTMSNTMKKCNKTLKK